jgi:hypothetical protein
MPRTAKDTNGNPEERKLTERHGERLSPTTPRLDNPNREDS